jgi:hypothetical protein
VPYGRWLKCPVGANFYVRLHRNIFGRLFGEALRVCDGLWHAPPFVKDGSDCGIAGRARRGATPMLETDLGCLEVQVPEVGHLRQRQETVNVLKVLELSPQDVRDRPVASA